MSWIYHFDDERQSRELFGDLLQACLPKEGLEQDEALPAFADWLQDFAGDLPCLLLLDYYTGTDSRPTEDFLRDFNVHQLTRHIPVILLTNASLQSIGAHAFTSLQIKDVLCKEQICSRIKRNDREERRISEAMQSLFGARLKALLREGRELRYMRIVQQCLQELPRRAGMLLLDPADEHSLVFATGDVLRFLSSFSDTPLGFGLPAPGILHDQSPEQDLVIEVESGSEMENRLIKVSVSNVSGLQLMQFQEEGTALYLQALWEKRISRDFFHHDWAVRAAASLLQCEQLTSNDPGQPPFQRRVRSYIGHLFSLAQVGAQVQEDANDGIKALAAIWQKEHLKEDYARVPIKQDLAAMHRRVTPFRLREADQMADRIRVLLMEVPLLESL